MAPAISLVADESPAAREERLLEEMSLAFIAGPLGPLDRWIDAWVSVGHAFKLEGDFANAKVCEDMASKLRAWQRTGIAPAAVLP